LFFNKTEEVKMSCSGERRGGASLFFERGAGWVGLYRPVASGEFRVGRERKRP